MNSSGGSKWPVFMLLVSIDALIAIAAIGVIVDGVIHRTFDIGLTILLFLASALIGIFTAGAVLAARQSK